MPLNTAEIIKLISDLCEEEKLRVSVKSSLIGGLITGGVAATGGLLAGPIGLAFGGAIGGGAAAYFMRGSFRSVADVILYDLSSTQREQLANSVRMFMHNRSISDLSSVMKLMATPAVKMILVQIVIQFLVAAVGVIWNRKENNDRHRNAHEQEVATDRCITSEGMDYRI